MKMAVSKKFQKYDQKRISGKLRYNGYERWRYVFSGSNRFTGEERTFFIEIYLVNPLISPKTVINAQKSRPIVSSADLQYALSGTISAHSVTEQENLKPSYGLVKCGIICENGKQFNRFVPSDGLTWNKKEQTLSISGCSFGPDMLTGQIEVFESEIAEHPEYFCNAGNIKWNLHYEKVYAAGPFIEKKSFWDFGGSKFWCPTGSKTVFAGSVEIDGVEYAINPKNSYGYIDKSWGDSLNDPQFHISSSNLVSNITGKPLTQSSFAVEGEYKNGINFHVCLEGEELEFSLNAARQFHDCIEAPADDEGEKLHWTLSVTEKSIVVDIDVFSALKSMILREYEVPEGERKMMKILTGAGGTGEIKIFKKHKEDLELIESAHIANCLCELGHVEVPEV